MPAGYSGTPLVKKLGIRPGARVSIIDCPLDYEVLIDGWPEGVQPLGARAQDLDFVHLFVRSRAALAKRLPTLRGRIKADGMIWVSWPKRASGVTTDVTEDVVREVALANRLVDVKVAAVDETWSGLKLVIRLADR